MLLGEKLSVADKLNNLPEGFESEDIAELRKILLNTQKQLIKAKQKTADLVEATYKGAYEAMLAMGPISPITAPKLDARKAKAEIALIHATDWQGSKVTLSYNTEIMKTRVMHFAKKIIELTDIQRAHHPVKECVVMFGGDMVEGLWNYGAQLWQIDNSLFGQFVSVSRLEVDFVRFLLSHFEKVTVIATAGNHGRIGSKRGEVPREDNVDRMTYEMARQILANEKRLTWDDDSEDIQKVEIGNYRALLMHGDEIGRGGFASPSAWIAAGNRWKSSFGWDFHDIYLGHYHRHAQEPMADGISTIYWTGSTESDNRYARDSMAVNGLPSQRLTFVDPNKGRVTSQYQVWLD
jgi:hypothetical protein